VAARTRVQHVDGSSTKLRVYPVARGRKGCHDSAVAMVPLSGYALALGSTRWQVGDTLLGYANVPLDLPRDLNRKVSNL
jgi:hypothetical protein